MSVLAKHFLDYVRTFVKELVDGSVTVDTCTWIAVPVPDTARGSTLLEDSDIVALFPESVMVSTSSTATIQRKPTCAKE